MNVLKLWSILGFSVMALGCTKASPEFSTLDSNAIPRPLFSGLNHKEITSLTNTETYVINGDCDPKITDLTAVAVGSLSALSIQAMATTPITVNCSSTGHFSFTLKSLTDLGFSPITNNTIYKVELRGITENGVSNPSVINITYSTSGGSVPQRIFVTSGSTESNAGNRVANGALGNFKAEIRVGNMMNKYSSTATAGAMQVKTGALGHFKMKSGVAAEN